MAEKTRMFGGEKYTFHGSFPSKLHAMSHLYNTVSLYRIKYRIVKRESRAPPQGDVWVDLYYRYRSDEEQYYKKNGKRK